MPARTTLRAWVWVLAGAVVVSIAPGRMALTDPDEARYAAASRELARGGDLFVPRFNGEPRLSKPPLIYWMQAASFRALGFSETAARLPSLLAAAALLALVGWWGERRCGAGTGGPAAAATAVTVLFFACARLALIDMLLAASMTAALLLWREAVETGAPGLRRQLAWAASAAIGLAALAKGPVGPALAGGVILLTAAVTRRCGAITARGVGLAAAGIALTAGPWVAALIGRIGSAGVLDLLKREAVERSFRGLDHPRPFYYFALTWWVTFLPWAPALPFILMRALRRRGDPETPFLLCWLGGTLVFFSLSADKNDAWLLPAAPALALAAARWLPRRLTLAVSVATAALLTLAAFLASGPIARERSLKELALAADLPHRGDYTLIAYRLYRPSLVFYADHPARWVSSGEELRRLLAELPGDEAVAIVMTRQRLEKLRAGGKVDLTGYRTAGVIREYAALFRSSAGPPDSQ